MNQVVKKIKDKPLFSYVIFNILYLLIGTYLCHNLVISKFAFSIGQSFVLMPINIFIIFKLRKKYIKNKADIFLILIGIFSIISLIFAYDKGVAFFGVDNRYEGLLMIFYYLSLTYISSYIDKEDKKKIIYLILGIGVYQFLYALCQKFEIMGVTLYEFKGEVYFSGITSNPNYFGIYMIICSGYALGLFIDEEKRKRKIIYLVLTIMFTMGLLMCNTFSCIVAFILVLIYAIIYMIVKKKYIKLLIIIFSILGTTICLHLLNATTVMDDLKLFKNQTERLAIKHEYSYNMGTGRIYVWKKTLEKVPDYLITGIGVDNFKFILDGKPIKRYDYYYDKVHNEYLQILITEGILCLLSYLILYIIVVIKGIKYSYKNNEIYLLLPVIGYLIQAFFNISVIDASPLFYIALGFLIIRNKKGEA